MTECAGDCVRIHATNVCSNQEMWPQEGNDVLEHKQIGEKIGVRWLDHEVQTFVGKAQYTTSGYN